MKAIGALIFLCGAGLFVYVYKMMYGKETERGAGKAKSDLKK